MGIERPVECPDREVDTDGVKCLGIRGWAVKCCRVVLWREEIGKSHVACILGVQRSTFRLSIIDKQTSNYVSASITSVLRTRHPCDPVLT
jgi:hypothetical protein